MAKGEILPSEKNVVLEGRVSALVFPMALVMQVIRLFRCLVITSDYYHYSQVVVII